MLHLLNHVAPAMAASEHAVNEQLAAAAPFIGMLAFAVFVGLLLITASYSSRGRSPEIGEYEDPAALPADEQAMLDDLGNPRH